MTWLKIASTTSKRADIVDKNSQDNEKGGVNELTSDLYRTHLEMTSHGKYRHFAI